MPEAVRHPALKAQDDIYASAQANQQLAQQNDQLNAQGQQLAQENQQLKQVMQDPNIDANVGGMNGPELTGPNGPEVDPVMALYEGVSQGATLDEMAELGMIEPALATMREQGMSPDEEAQIFQELEELGSAGSQAGKNPYNLN